MNKTVIYKEDAIALLDYLENYIMELEGWQEKCDGVSQAKELIADMPGIEVEPVRHGYWQDGGCYEICSVCGADHDRYDDGGYLQDFAYCPACGAKMDLEEPTNE